LHTPCWNLGRYCRVYVSSITHRSIQCSTLYLIPPSDFILQVLLGRKTVRTLWIHNISKSPSLHLCNTSSRPQCHTSRHISSHSTCPHHTQTKYRQTRNWSSKIQLSTQDSSFHSSATIAAGLLSPTTKSSRQTFKHHGLFHQGRRYVNGRR
jgi:hypothetical protein